MSNVAVNLNYGIQAVDTVASVSVFNRAISGFQLQATSWQAADWLQVPVFPGIVLALPAIPVFFVYIRNLGTNNIVLNFTPSGFSTATIILLPVGSNVGGIFLYGLSAETAGGITNLGMSAAISTTPVEYFVAA